MATPEQIRRRISARSRLAQTERSLRREQLKATALGLPTEDVEPDEPLFLEILDVLNRPQQAIFQVVESIQNGEDWKQTLEESWGGLTGELDRITFGDILRNAGLQDGQAVTVAGFIGDLTLDPLNLLPIGVTSKIIKAARIKLLASPEGRRAMQWTAEALREAPGLGPARRNLGRMFNTGDVLSLTDRPISQQVRGYVRSVERRLEELENLDEPLVAFRKRELVTITGRRAPGAPIEDIPTITARAVPLERTDDAIRAAREVDDHLEVIRRMGNAHEQGRMPHEILADYIRSSKESAIVAKQGMLTEWLPAIGNFFRKAINGLSEGDQRLVAMAAEEASIVDKAVRAEKLKPILEQAENKMGALRGAVNLRRMYDKLEDIGELAGVKSARLGGSLLRRREEIYREAERALENVEFGAWKETAQAIRTTAFGSKKAQNQAFALADALDQVGKGKLQRGDVLGLLEEMDALRGSLKSMRKGKVAKLSAQALKYNQRGTELSGTSVFEALTKGIVDPKIAAGKAAVLARRTEDIEKLTRLIDRLPGYVLHYMDDETVEWLGKNIGRSDVAGALGSAGHRSLIERKWVDDHGVPLSLQDVQKILTAKADDLADLGRDLLRRRRTWWDLLRGRPGDVGEYFGLDATAALSIRAQRTVQAISGQEFRQGVSKIFGRYAGADGVRMPGFDGTFAPELQQIVTHMDEAYFGEAASRSFLRFYDGAQQIWKGFTLFPFAAYHARNAIGDLWLMTAGGFFTRETKGRGGILEPFWRAIPDGQAHLDLVRAYRIQAHLTTGNIDGLKSIKFTLPTGETWDGAQLYEAIRRKGGVGIGFHADNLKAAADTEVKLTDALFVGSGGGRSVISGAVSNFNPRAIFPEALSSLADLRTWVMPSQLPRNALIRGGRAVAEGISDSHRFAMIMKRMRVGDSLDEAVRHSKKWLLDYTDLTPFETQVGRRAFPFYTWLRKNLPRQVETLFDNPRRLARIDHLARFIRDPESPAQPFLSAIGGDGMGLRGDEGPEPVEIPEWMRQSVPFPLRRRADGTLEMITIAAWHPGAELQRVAPETVGKTFIDMLSPLLKLPLETALERNFFFDQELDGTSEFLGRELPAKWANALQNVRLLAEFDRLNWFSEMGFSTRRLRPETEEETLQKLLRLFTGAKIYPLDTRMAKARNLQPALERLRRRRRQEQSARRRENQ